MTIQIADTAELPRTPSVAPVTVSPVVDSPGRPEPELVVAARAAPPPQRRGAQHAVRSERRVELRRRRLAAIGGLAVLVVFLAATVAVLGVVR